MDYLKPLKKHAYSENVKTESQYRKITIIVLKPSLRVIFQIPSYIQIIHLVFTPLI